MVAFNPDLALTYLAELEPGLDAVAVLGADGTCLAGDASLARAEAAAGVFIARSARHAVLARAGPGALGPLVQHDLRLVAEALEA
jgi:hypothetical protein